MDPNDLSDFLTIPTYPTTTTTATLDTCIPVPLNDDVLEEITSKAKDWALMHGAAMRARGTYDDNTLQFAPFSLLPTLFPRREFEKAVELQPVLNELMHWVANDSDFLRNTLARTIEVDDFTKKLFDIYERVLADENPAQEVSLGLFRSDFMVQTSESNVIKQVEFNTIASSFAGISSNLNQLHSYVLTELGHHDLVQNLPQNNALSGLCHALIQAYQVVDIPGGVILFIVEDVTYNICDQRFHEFCLRKERPDIKIIRKTLTQMGDRAKLGPNRELLIDEDVVSVVYYRAGYVPDHYPSEKEWDARYLIEQSSAIKCPSINYHLAGTKKVQQELATEGILSRFLSDQTMIKRITEIFTGLYPMEVDTEEGTKSRGRILMGGDTYILKPQREGGGHNVYGYDIASFVASLKDKKQLQGYILMDRIYPPTAKGYIVRPYDENPLPQLIDVVSELGIFGAIIGDKTAIIYNSQCGHMLRTKQARATEGGVASGYGSLDSPFLYDD